MADTWPPELPRFFIAGSYSESEAPGNLIETPEVAVPKSRPLSSAAARRISGDMIMTLPQLAIFRTFGRTALVQWSLPFWFPAHSGESDTAKPGYLLVKFRKDGVPQMGMIRASHFTLTLGFWVMP